MLTASFASTPFAGALFGTAAVENLQKAMVSLAQAANWPIANPGPVTGQVNDQTLTALGGIVQSVPDIPANIKSVLALALAGAMFNSGAKAEAIQLVESYAAELTTAITAMIAKYTGASQPGASNTTRPKLGLQLQTIAPGLVTQNIAPRSPVAGGQAGGSTSSFLPPVAPGTPWYKNYKILGGAALVGVAGIVTYKILA